MHSIKERYLQFLNTKSGLRLYNEFKRILYSESDSLVESLDNNLLQSLDIVKKDVLRVCDIGGADGRRIVHILKYLHDKFGIQAQLDLIEQSRVCINAFDTSPIDGFCRTNRILGKFEDVHLDGDYDLVLLIHSIFAFDNGEALDKVLGLRSNEGKIVVVSNSSDSLLQGLKWHVDEGFDDKRYEIDALVSDLERRNIRHTSESFATRWAIDLSAYDELSKIILDWISLDRFEDFDEDKKQLIRGFLKEQAQEAKNRFYFCENEVVVVIPPL